MSLNLQQPKPPHGQRLLIPQIDIIAETEPDRAWISVPADDSDLSKGYVDITFRQLANASNRATAWLRDNLDLPTWKFHAFAYAGSKDYRYILLAIAAAKLGYQMVLPASTITPVGQVRILAQKECSYYLCTKETAAVIEGIKALNPELKSLMVPDLQYFTNEEPVAKIPYEKAWQDGKSDPWLVFHTSGTTGFPKAVTCTQHMLSTPDIALGLSDLERSSITLGQNCRTYVPIPPMHYVPIFMMLSATTWVGAVPVLHPATQPPIPPVVKGILKYARVNAALLVPALIDALCRDPEALELLRGLDHISYAGASMSLGSGKLLADHVQLVPAIGSTDAGAYLVSLPNVKEDWDYVSFQPHTGAVLEHRANGLHELVFIRNPQCALQVMFDPHPDLQRFETQDLWIEHPTKKGQWKIVGRTDDLIKLASGHGLHVTPLEAILSEHPQIQTVLIGGKGRPQPVILIELHTQPSDPPTTAQEEDDSTSPTAATTTFLQTFSPLITKANAQCHDEVKLNPHLIVFATREKPWLRTIKDTVARGPVLELYRDEIDHVYAKIGL